MLMLPFWVLELLLLVVVYGTSCTYTAQKFNIMASGTMAHSFVQSFDSEYEAFKTYAEIYPKGCTLLVDTYNTLESGVPNAIKVFDELLEPMGIRPVAVRLDSGDLAYLSKKVRVMLDKAGYEDCKICLTNSLDEYLIASLLKQGAKVDSFGVGENLITAKQGTTLEEAQKILCKHRIEKLPIVDEKNNLKGLITIKDIEKAIQYPNSAKDSNGRLLAGAAVGVTADTMERVEELVRAKVDLITIDTAHGHNQGVLDMVR